MAFLNDLKFLLNESGYRVKEGFMFYEIIEAKLLSRVLVANITDIS